METLQITSFAGLQAADFQIRPFTLFIGPQAAGKSVVAKLLYYFRQVPRKLMEGAQEQLDWHDFVAAEEDRFLSLFPAEAWGEVTFEVIYHHNLNRLGVSSVEANGGRSAQIKFPGEYRDLYETLGKTFSQEADESSEDSNKWEEAQRIMRGRSERLLMRQLGKEALSQEIYVTATRAFFTKRRLQCSHKCVKVNRWIHLPLSLAVCWNGLEKFFRAGDFGVAKER